MPVCGVTSARAAHRHNAPLCILEEGWSYKQNPPRSTATATAPPLQAQFSSFHNRNCAHIVPNKEDVLSLRHANMPTWLGFPLSPAMYRSTNDSNSSLWAPPSPAMRLRHVPDFTEMLEPFGEWGSSASGLVGALEAVR